MIKYFSKGFLLIVLFFYFSNGNCELNCPNGGTLYPEYGVCIFLIGMDTFYNAEATCLQLNSHLPSVHDEYMNNMLWNISRSSLPCYEIWVGMDIRKTWLDGSELNYTKWAPGQPNWSSVTCVVLSGESANGTHDVNWSTADCYDTAAFACVMQAQQVTTTTMMSTTTKTTTTTTTTVKKLTVNTPSTALTPLGCENPSAIKRLFYEPEKLDGEPTACPLGGKDKLCSHWTVVVGIILANNSDSDLRLETTKDFVKQVTQYCDYDSSVILITPALSTDKHNYTCTYLAATKETVHSVIDDITLEQVVVSDAEAANVTVNMFRTLGTCAQAHIKIETGAVLFFITSLDCAALCSRDVYNQQSIIISDLINKNFLIRFILNSNDKSGDEAHCLGKVFADCALYPTSCNAPREIDDSCTMEQLADEMLTCPKKPSRIPIAEIIIWTIVVTLGVVALVLFLLYRRYNNKFKSWKLFWQGQSVLRRRTSNTAAKENNYTDFEQVVADNWEIERNNLEIRDILGSGAFASVYLAHLKGEVPLARRKQINLGLHQDSEGRYKVAVKRLPVYATKESRADFAHELTFMKNLGYHPHIMGLLGCVSTASDPLIVLELCPKGDLLTMIRSKKETFSQAGNAFPDELKIKDLISLVWQVTDGIHYLTANNFIHRDIAARNVLLTEDMTAKIGDFGLCRLVDTSQYNAKGGRLPIKWMAPESIKYYEYSFKSDVWSFGVLMFEVFSLGEAPYQTIQPGEMRSFLEDGGRLEQPSMCPNEIYAIMQHCWKFEVDERPDISQIRDELSDLLNADSESYGYLDINKKEKKMEELDDSSENEMNKF